MSKVYFISDLHLGHRSILKYRPEFASIEEHDNTIFDNIMSLANKRNSLWILGDIAFERGENDKYYNMLKTISDSFDSLNVVIGNHDSDNSYRQQLLLDLWKDGVYSKVHSLVGYKDAWLTHCPIHPDEIRNKKMVIHGHTHNFVVDDGRYFNVCCEQVDYTPINFQVIKEIVRNRT